MLRYSYLIATLLLFLFSHHAHGEDIPWVWHSSEAPDKTLRIALLLDHLTLFGDTLTVRHRMRRLNMDDDGVLVTPVIHVQSDLSRLPALNQSQTRAIVNAVKAAGRRSTSGWVQLDFEALESQKAYYADLVSTLRHELPPSIKLSITTLASWCVGASPLENLAADEIVPMFFRMGSAGKDYWRRLILAPEQLHPLCRAQSIGFAVQEAPPPAVQQRYKRRYWFNFKNWNRISKGE